MSVYEVTAAPVGATRSFGPAAPTRTPEFRLEISQLQIGVEYVFRVQASSPAQASGVMLGVHPDAAPFIPATFTRGCLHAPIALQESKPLPPSPAPAGRECYLRPGRRRLCARHPAGYPPSEPAPLLNPSVTCLAGGRNAVLPPAAALGAH